MKTNWRIELALLALIALMFAAAIIVWPAAPADIPVHGNASGDVDRYGGKVEGRLGKVRPNWFAGIRTPWTLSSFESWARTHRLGGRVFVALGVLFVVTGLFKLGSFGDVVIGTALAAVAALVVYSYVVWRSDATKQPAAGMQPADEG